MRHLNRRFYFLEDEHGGIRAVVLPVFVGDELVQHFEPWMEEDGRQPNPRGPLAYGIGGGGTVGTASPAVQDWNRRANANRDMSDRPGFERKTLPAAMVDIMSSGTTSSHRFAANIHELTPQNDPAAQSFTLHPFGGPDGRPYARGARPLTVTLPPTELHATIYEGVRQLLGILAWWVNDTPKVDPRPFHSRFAREWLSEALDRDPEPVEVATLATELLALLRSFIARPAVLRRLQPRREWHSTTIDTVWDEADRTRDELLRGEPLWLDLELAELLAEAGGAEASKVAANLPNRAAGRAKNFKGQQLLPGTQPDWMDAYRNWLDTDPSRALPCRVLRTLCRVLWNDHVRVFVHGEHKPAAATMELFDHVKRTHTTRNRRPIEAGNGSYEVITSTGDIVGFIPPRMDTLTLAAAATIVHGSERAAFALAFSDIVADTWALHLRRKAGQSVEIGRLIFPGLKAWAKELGVDKDSLEDALAAGQHVHMVLANGDRIGGLWTYDIRPGHRGQPAHVRVAVADALLDRIGGAGPGTFAPVLPSCMRAPLIGRRNEHAEQETLFRLHILPELRQLARQLFTNGATPADGWHLPLRWWQERCTDVGLGEQWAERIRNAYVDGTPATKHREAVPSVLVKVGADRYRLAPHFKRYEATIIEGGEISHGRSVAGQAGAAKRTGKAKRYSSKSRN